MVSYNATINATGFDQVTVVNNTTPEVVHKTEFPATYAFTSGDSLTFIAIPSAGYNFNYWTVGVAIYSANPYTTGALTAPYAITAVPISTSLYCNQTQVETWAKISSSDIGTIGEDYEGSVAYFIDVASRAVDRELDVPEGFFAAGGLEIEELYDGVELGWVSSWVENPFSCIGVYPILRLNYRPILSLDKVESQNSGGAWAELTEGTDYVEDSAGVRFLRNIPRYTYGNIRVTYTAGYVAVPTQISNVSAQLAAAILQRVVDSKSRRTSALASISLTTPTEFMGFAQSCFSDSLKAEITRFRNIIPPKVI